MTATPAPLDPEPLLARAARVRALARVLSRDPGGAEDLAQDALVVALERRGSGGPPLAWFRRVLERLAVDRGRSEGARRGRERHVARPEAQPGTLDLVARADLQRRLVEAVLALPEPYREALLERWFEERSPEEIARRVGVPASTVRTRLARGLALLRERLRRTEGRDWLPALAALGGGRGGTIVEAGGVLVGTGTKVVLVASAVAGMLWLAWPERRRPQAPVEEAVASAPDLEPARPPLLAGGEVGGRAKPILEPSVPVPAPVTVTSDEISEAECEVLEMELGLHEAPTLRGLVLRGRTPITAGTAWLCSGNRFAPQDPRQPWPGIATALPRPGADEPRSAPIGPDGRFVFEEVRPDWITLAIDPGEGVVRQMAMNAMTGGRTWRTIVIVLGSAGVSGHVYDEQGVPVAGARVVAFQGLRRNEEGRGFASVAWTDAEGRYALADLPAGSFSVGVRRDGAAKDPNTEESVPLDLAVGQQATLDFGVARPLPVWSGVLRARTGEPSEGAWLTLRETTTGWNRELLVSDGTFRISLPSGTYVASTRKVPQSFGTVELATVEVGPAGLERDLERPGTRLRGLALDALSDAPWTRNDAQSVSIRPGGHGYPAAITSRRLGPDGTFVFDGLEPGEWVLGGYPLEARAIGGGEASITILEGEIEASLTVALGPR
jgi:RNA polymerase sigma factor (sigma-70 family)